VNPRVTVIIPARGGSKGVPGKNLRRVGGRSLVERAVDARRAARLVDEVNVSTDDVEIAGRAEAAGGTGHGFPQLARGQASGIRPTPHFPR
jgi:CMP-N-acetylneuraminic acid synthetase